MAEQLFKDTTPQPEKPLQTTEDAAKDSSKLVDSIVKHRKTFASAFIGVCLLGGLFVWQITAQSAKRAKDFEQAHFLAEDLEKNSFSSDDEESSRKSIVTKLTALNDAYPDLHKRYDGILAEEYIFQQNQNKVDPYAKRAIEELRAVGLSQYAQFSEVSRLAAKNKLTDALALAKTLNDSLKKEASSNTFSLRVYTLIELVGLHKKLGSDQEAKAAIDEVRLLLQESGQYTLSAEEQEIAMKIRKDLEEESSSLLEFLQNT